MPIYLDQQDGRTSDAALGQIGQRRIGPAEWILRAGHLDVVLPRKRQELACVPAGVGSHRPQMALLEQVALVVQNGDVAEIDAGDRQRASTVERLESG